MMDSKQIEIEGMKELLKENELEIGRLRKEIKTLKEENADLKSELSKFRDSFKKYRDYEKEELAESCYDLARENQKLKELLQKVGKENSELQAQVREQYYTIKQYERGFDIGSYEGDDERAG